MWESKTKKCSLEWCGRPLSCKGFCAGHYGQMRAGRPLSSLPDRSRKIRGAGIRTREEVLFRDGEGRKICTCCGEWLEESKFYVFKYSADQLDAVCSECKLLENRSRVFKTPVEELRRMHSQQSGKCRICLEQLPLSRLHIDHDHACCPGYRSCGMCVRGLLCRACNLSLGQCKESIPRLKGMIEYLVGWESSSREKRET